MQIHGSSDTSQMQLMIPFCNFSNTTTRALTKTAATIVLLIFMSKGLKIFEGG